jgi:hypothetical protein
MAMAASAAGEIDKAIAHARQAYEIRDPMLALVNHWPDFASVVPIPAFRTF